MKTGLKYILLLIISIFLYCSCDEQLDIAPKNIMTNDQVFSNESAITAYLASLYRGLPVESFSFSAKNGFNSWISGTLPAHTSGEALGTYGTTSVGDGTWYQWGGYSTIRNVNLFIANLPGSNLSEGKKQAYLGEAMFLRAYDYFGLVKRYGGVPIIRSVQNFTGDNLGELQVSRNTEKEVYDFIASQLDSAIALMPETNAKGRANKYIALALKSRAMLFAGSIARYGSVQLNGLVGIPATEANKYFQASFDAAKAVIESGKYSLYKSKPDKVDNFTSLFIETTNNPEVIFAQDYYYPGLAHSYDCWFLPFSVRSPWGYSSSMNPTLEIVEEFEYIDGTPGTLKFTDGTGAPIKYSNPMDLFRDKDPRCMATVIIPFGKYRGSVIHVQAGIIDDATSVNTGIVYGRKMVSVGSYTQRYDAASHSISATGDYPIIGIDGIGGGERSLTGFYIRKYLDYNREKSLAIGGRSTQSWIEFRFAEILLNYAESAVELGNIAAAKNTVNQVRDRAGIALLNDGEVTKDRVRHERTVELAFENHRYWDIRRWRTADQLILNKKYGIILPYFDLQAKAYIFSKGSYANSLTFWPKMYYEQILPSEIEKNPKLIQNPLY